MREKTYTIAIYGSSAITQDTEQARAAHHMGRVLAEAGFAICNGGYMGAMEAASRGAKEAGGEVIGVTCKSFIDRSPNPYLTKEIQTVDLPERISTLMRIADAYIVLPGSIGTMAELFLGWNMAAMGYDRPVVVVGENLKSAVLGLQKYTEIGEKHLRLLTFVEDIEGALREILSKFKKD